MLARVIRYAAWPFFVLGSTWAFAASFGTGQWAIATFAVGTGCMVAIYLLELAAPRQAGRSAPGDPEAWNDVGHAVVGGVIGPTIGELIFLVAAAAAAAEIGEAFGGNLWPSHWPGFVQLLLMLVVADGLEYWRHRLMHRVSWLWSSHAIHHSCDRLHVLKSGRTHAFDMIARTISVLAPLALLGAPRELIYTYPAAIAVIGPIAHSNLDLRVPRFLHRWIVTPHVHRIHHARALELSDSNYAAIFTFWDVVFRTYKDPSRNPDPVIGMESEPLPRNFLRQLGFPLRVNRTDQGPTAG